MAGRAIPVLFHVLMITHGVMLTQLEASVPNFQVGLNSEINRSFIENKSNNYIYSDINYSIIINADYYFNSKKDWSIGFYNLYTSGDNRGYNRISNFNKCGVTLSMSFLNNNLQLLFEINDIFNSEAKSYYTVVDDVKYEYDKIPDSRYFRFSLTYSFNKKNVEEEYIHNSTNEEKNRF